jgi:exodeoxyribonuclease V alpha subunit
MATTINPQRLAELLSRARAARHIEPVLSADTLTTPVELTVDTTPTVPDISQATDRFGNDIVYNTKQTEFITLASAGKSCILVGAAGTGKTTVMKGTMSALMASGRIPLFNPTMVHKHLKPETYGIAIVAFTRRATNNIRKNVSLELRDNCITIHKLLEYQPVIYETVDDDGNTVNKRVFEPTRNKYNPLPPELRVIAFEESSMVSTELHKLVIDALPDPSKVQIIYLGDIQQLPPVFGSAILGYKMLELPTVELTEVYRQALESPIIRLAHRILSGVPIKLAELPDWTVPDQLKLHPWKKKLSSDIALHTAAKFFTSALDNGVYNYENDIILIPYNKAFGTDELNKFIAQHIARKSHRETFEIIAGFNKHYYSIGDKVLYDKEDAIITNIQRNPIYSGKRTQPASQTLDYWGYDSATAVQPKTEEVMTEEQIDFMLAQVADGTGEDRVRQASHIITLAMQDSELELKLDTANTLNAMILGYAITVHKSQGSEWDKVFLVLHQSHATMLQRELLYTAVTRAKKELYVICEPESFVNGIESQRIKGNTLEAKIEFFKGKQERMA